MYVCMYVCIRPGRIRDRSFFYGRGAGGGLVGFGGVSFGNCMTPSS